MIARASSPQLLEYPLPALVGRLTTAAGSSLAAEQLVVELKRFLITAAATREPLVPSAEVDAAWHELVLDTKQYRAFCDALGTFVDHVPTEDPRGANRAYVHTRRILAERFGVLDTRF